MLCQAYPHIVRFAAKEAMLPIWGQLVDSLQASMAEMTGGATSRKALVHCMR